AKEQRNAPFRRLWRSGRAAAFLVTNQQRISWLHDLDRASLELLVVLHVLKDGFRDLAKFGVVALPHDRSGEVYVAVIQPRRAVVVADRGSSELAVRPGERGRAAVVEGTACVAPVLAEEV